MNQYENLSDAQKEFVQQSVECAREKGNDCFQLNRWGGLWSVIGEPNGGGFEGPGTKGGTPQIDFSFFQELEDSGLLQIERVSGRSWRYTLTDAAYGLADG